MLNGQCHACNAENAYQQYYWYRGDHMPVPLIEDTYICGKCKHIFRHYKGDVEEYHREKYRTQGEEGHEMYSEQERYHYIGNFLEAADSFLNKEQVALEIGSGDGLLATKARERVKKIVCSDIDKKMTDKCANLGFEVVNKSVLDIEEKYDVVIGMDVLEHVLDIKKFSEKMADIVNEYLILQVPVNRTMVPPNPVFCGHSHYFSRESIFKLFEKNFKPVRDYYGDRGTFARGPEMLCIWKKQNFTFSS